MKERLTWFWENADFDTVFNYVSYLDPVEIFFNPNIIVPVLVVLSLMMYQKTTDLGQKLFMYIPTLVYFFVTATVLKNDSISSPGPFAMAFVGFLIVMIWFIWTKMLRD